MNAMKTSALCVCGAAAIVGAFLVGRARADGIAATGGLTYSGTLEDTNGAPLTGTKQMQVSIFDSATAGTLQCGAGPMPIALVGGRFQLLLPDTCTAAVSANPDLWIEVFVDGATLGRTKLGAVPYAVEAARASAAAGALQQQIVPSGAVMAFDLDACPAGWTAFASAAGHTIVGVDSRVRGTTLGAETHTMTVNEMPAHSHTNEIRGTVGTFNNNDINLYWSGGSAVASTFGTSRPSNNTGGGAAFSIMQPSLFLLYCKKL
jgi:hypothetical protein